MEQIDLNGSEMSISGLPIHFLKSRAAYILCEELAVVCHHTAYWNCLLRATIYQQAGRVVV